MDFTHRNFFPLFPKEEFEKFHPFVFPQLFFSLIFSRGSLCGRHGEAQHYCCCGMLLAFSFLVSFFVFLQLFLFFSFLSFFFFFSFFLFFSFLFFSFLFFSFLFFSFLSFFFLLILSYLILSFLFFSFLFFLLLSSFLFFSFLFFFFSFFLFISFFLFFSLFFLSIVCPALFCTAKKHKTYFLISHSFPNLALRHLNHSGFRNRYLQWLYF